ncbi:hypothetical protein IMSHALPRED_001066 [Imshaugia aleurites]|uniref:6-phosphogluconate dehydrogenase, decarboxylating n=1 Tax=Imshaugia aleurites TaxID=172621 RepID=A0A8H3J135_9LECA|nr:hypothetical protein IMSHALPRED_001066 [Imshaugia aleurites]
MIGCGSMGGGMSLLFADHGITVLLNDPSESTVDGLLKTAEKDGIRNKLEKHLDYGDLCANLDSPKVFVFSLPHGTIGDSVVEGLHPYLEKGDLIIDASNENWKNTQRRQGKLITQGVHYVGMGVSGGYQAARRGPSMCPGGEDRALDMALPLLQKVAARDARGNPCVGRCGMGGSGHYVKMIHNGIEHGMMSAQAEAWQIMSLGLGMTYDEIGDVFAKWNADGELRGTFLIDIGAQINKQRDDKGNHVLSVVEDKVVQDIDGTEGTGVWSSEEAIRLHVPAPTLSDAHYVRVASAFRKDRKKVKATFGGHFPLQKWSESEEEKPAFLEDLRKAVYTAFLAAFVQGINIIDLADQENKWSINFPEVIQIWRNGCIIRADYIADLLEGIFTNAKDVDRDLLHHKRIAKEFSTNFPALKQVVGMGVQTNAIIPSLSASLEYLKYSVNTSLPTQFYEAQLDLFGKHMFDLKSEPAGGPVTGHHHYEWKPA